MIEYIKYPHPYKYEFKRDTVTDGPRRFYTGIEGYEYQGEYMELDTDGWVTIQHRYKWDGPSGPAYDSEDFMTPSMDHDAGYQLIRMSVLPEKYRSVFDKHMRKECRKRGMKEWRVWRVYHGVKWFAKNAAKAGTQPTTPELLYAP